MNGHHLAFSNQTFLQVEGICKEFNLNWNSQNRQWLWTHTGSKTTYDVYITGKYMYCAKHKLST